MPARHGGVWGYGTTAVEGRGRGEGGGREDGKGAGGSRTEKQPDKVTLDIIFVCLFVSFFWWWEGGGGG